MDSSVAEFRIWIPHQAALAVMQEFQKEKTAQVIDKNPDEENADAARDGFFADRAFQFRDEGAHLPDQPGANNGFEKIDPIASGFAKLVLQSGENDESEKRRHAGRGRRLG